MPRPWLAALPPVEVARAIGGLLPGAALVGADTDGRVTLWTEEAERLFGWTSEQIVGSRCPVCAAGVASGALVEVQRPDGGVVLVRHHGRIVADGAGAALGSFHVFTSEAATADVAPRDAVEFHGLLTREPAMLRIFDIVRNVAQTDTTVLVRGESGTGKELVAQAIHAESRRRDRPFVAVNCAAFAPTLLESELFGHRRGAFTGAIADREGIFAQADGGTLFLDEVAEIPLELQAKMLRVLQEQVFVPVGANKPVRVDVRIVAATHRALREEVRAGRFREDLMYRLRVVPVFLPALRERPRDIELLLQVFMARRNERGPRRAHRVAPDALRALLAYPWPGNVRELSNVVEHAYAVGRGDEITLDELPPELREPAPPVVKIDADAIRKALEASGGDVGKAAASLGVARTTFWRRRKALGV